MASHSVNNTVNLCQDMDFTHYLFNHQLPFLGFKYVWKLCLHGRDNFMAGNEFKEQVMNSRFLHLIQHVVICMRHEMEIFC